MSTLTSEQIKLDKAVAKKRELLQEHMLEAYQHKLDMEEAKDIYDKKRYIILESLIELGLEELTIADEELLEQFEIPVLKAQITSKVTNNIDPIQYKTYVSDDEFYDSISVSVTKAKAFMRQRDFDAIATKEQGKPYIEFKVK